jgi:gliding motility-associated-like protein/uncharacterized repeat protein (TIGR01451 family)
MKKITHLFCLFFSLVGLAQTTNLVISKTSPAPIYYPSVDTTITYFVQIGNNAAVNAEDVLVEIPFDTSVDLASVAWIAPDGTTGTGVISQTIDIDAGQIVVYQISVALPTGYIQGTSLIASVDTTHPTLSANLLNNITNYTYVAGTDMVYTITIENQGSEDALNVEVEDIIPTILGMDLTSVSWTGSNGTTGTGNLTDTIALLLVGDTVSYTISLPIPDGYNETITNNINVTADNAITDGICFACTHSANPQEPLAQLDIQKTSPQATYPQGITKITYFVQVGNNDTNDAQDVTVSIPYHPSVTAVTAQWKAPDGTTGTGNINHTTDILSGEIVVYEVTFNIPAGYVAGTNLIDDVFTSHPTITNFVHQVTDYIYIASTNLVYTITIENTGLVNALNVEIEDIIPTIPGMDLASVSWTGSNGTMGTGNLTDTIAVLPVGDIVIYTITLPIPIDYIGETIVNSVNLTADNLGNQGICLGCNHYAKSQEPRAHIVTTKTNDITHYVKGTYVDYIITITNEGPHPAQNVLVFDPLPYGITQMTWIGNGTAGIGQLNHTIPLLANGQTVVFNVQVFVPDDFDIEVNLVNNVWVTTPTLDPNPQLQPITHIDFPAVNYVTVNDSQYSLNELVNDVLIDMDCSLVENISAQGFRSNNNTMGYFHANNSDFPIKSGIVIRTGPVVGVQGPYNNYAGATNGSGQTDAQLNAIGGGTLLDVSYIEFDFTPITDELKFNFLFASNEYLPQFQCSYGDVFAFILTDLTTGEIRNLAVIPGTNPPIPVAVTTIRNGASGCGPAHIEYFGGINTTGDAINLVGNTTKMTASGSVIPCRKYRIKLAIGDWGDTGYDSAVFLEAGSFDIGTLDLGENFLESQGSAVCPNDETILTSGLAEIEGSCDIEYDYQWYKDGIAIVGAINPNYQVSETGTYTLETTITIAGTIVSTECSLKPGSVVVEFFDEIPAGEPDDLTNCIGNNIFNLTQRYTQIYGDDLDPNDTNITFHLDMDYLDMEFPIEWGTFEGNTDNTDITAFEGTNGQTIYVRVQVLNGSPCYAVREITLNIIDCSVTAPNDIELCDNDDNGSETVDLSLLIDDIILGLEDHTVTFHTTQTGADNGGIDVIDHNVPYAVNAGATVTVYVRAEDDNLGISSTTSFTITVFEAPQIEQNISDYELCSSNIDNTAAFDLTSKTNEILDGATATLSFYTSFADADADVSPITTPETYSSAGEIIYVKATDANGCYSITSFELVINDDFQIEQDITDYELCDENGNGEEEFDLTTKTTEILGTQTATLTFYTSQANAQAGTDDIATPRTSTGETIWVRAETADGCFDITSFLLVVKPLGSVPSPAPIEVCANNNATSVTFDLTSVLGDVMGAPTDVVTFHQTLAAAQAATAAITPANAYVASANQTIYIRIVSQDDDICPAISSVNLVKLDAPILATTITDYELCDNGTGQAEFDLNSKETEILGTSTATLTYYTSQANATDKVDEITTPATYMSASATIWVRAENANDCYTIKSFNLVLHVIPVANAPEPLAKCNDGTGQAEFDLNSRNNTISGGAVGVVVTYHTSLVDAENGDNPQTSPYTGTHQEILYVRVASPFGCVNTTQTLELILEESTIAPILPELTYCDPNSDGWGIFDLTQIEQIILDANPSLVSITYHETIEDATFLANIIDNPEEYFNIGYYTQTIYIAITPASGEACSSIAQVNLIVYNLPQITAPTPIETCDDDYDGFANFDLTIRNTEILNGLNPADHTIIHYPTESDANAATNAIANPTNYTNTVANQDSVWVRVTDLTTGCYAIKELVLIVNPLPVVDMPNVAEYRLCDFGEDGYEIFDLDSRVEIILDGQTGLTVSFYKTYDNAFDGVQPITDLMYQNQEQYVETIFVRVETQKGCFVVTLMDLVVDPLPVLSTPTNPIVSCDGDGDGYGTVNLEEILEEMFNGANPADFIISFHETYSDAELNANSIDNPQEYYNIDPFNQVIYIRVESTLGSGCYNIYPITIEVISAPVLPVEMDGTLPDLVLCDDNQDGLTHFDLTVQTAYILDQQTDITNLEVTYYISEHNAIDRALAIGNMTNYPNISNPQTIWVVLENSLTGCYDMAAFDLVVNLPLDVPMVIPSITLCDEDGDLEVTFDLTVRLDAILANASDPNNYTVEFFYTYTDAINGNTTNLIADPTNFSNLELGGGAVYTLGVRVTDNTTGCQSYALMDIRRAPMPNIPVVPLDPLEVCDNTNDDLIEAFDLTVYESFIRNGDSNVIITYHPTSENAQEGTNAIVDPTAYESASTTIYIRVANKPNGGVSCAVILELELIVNPLPIVADNSFEICETNSSGYAEFFFPDFNPQLLGPTQDLADFTISYHLTQADAISGTAHIPQGTPYTNHTQFAEVIWVRIVNNDTGCIRIAEITLYAEEGAVANQPANPIFECDYDGTNDGITNTDLTQYEAEILGAQNPAQFIVTYYLTEDDANDATNAIINPENFTNTVAGGQTIYIRVENSDSNAPCYDVTQMEYIVEELAEPVITSPLNTICVDWGSTLANDPLVLDSNITAAGYSFEWYRNGTLIAGADQSTYTITSKGQEGSYYVIATSAEGCVSEVSNTFEVFLSGQATLVDIITENAFSDNQTITVIVEGNGQYVYQLDNGPIQQTGYFPNVTAGEHTVTVYDTTNGNINTINSCGTLLISDVQIIDYPRFFTPNGDGYNDLWNITGLTDFHKAEIYIFDRHGKLLKQLNPQGEGWNGTLNGNQLPATDYWFKVIYTENNNRKEFRAHFSLKR